MSENVASPTPTIVWRTSKDVKLCVTAVSQVAALQISAPTMMSALRELRSANTPTPGAQHM